MNGSRAGVAGSRIEEVDLTQAQQCCQRRKRKVHGQVEQLQQQRQEQLAPSRLYLPPPWQPVVFKQPTPMFMVVAAEGSSFVTLHDSRLQFTPQRWAFGPADWAWAPLWACMHTYTTAAEAKAAVCAQRGSRSSSSSSSSITKGALVLARVVVKGKAYTCAGSGCVAVPALLFDAVLEYVPQTPKERLMSVDYVAGTAAQGQCNL